MTTTELMHLWAQALIADQQLDAVCRANSGKGLTVFVGLDGAVEPGRSCAPYVAMQDIGAQRGPEADEHKWGIMLFLGWETKQKADKTARVIVDPATDQMDNIFSRHVMRVLSATESPPEYGHCVTHPTKAGYAERDIVVTVSEENTIYPGETGWD